MTIKVTKFFDDIIVRFSEQIEEIIQNKKVKKYRFTFTDFDTNEIITSADVETEAEFKDFKFQQKIYNALLEYNPQYSTIVISGMDDTGARVWTSGYETHVITVDEWKNLLKDKTIFTDEVLKLLKQMKNYESPVDYQYLNNGFILDSFVDSITETQNLIPNFYIEDIGTTYVLKEILLYPKNNTAHILAPNLSKALDEVDLSNY